MTNRAVSYSVDRLKRIIYDQNVELQVLKRKYGEIEILDKVNKTPLQTESKMERGFTLQQVERLKQKVNTYEEKYHALKRDHGVLKESIFVYKEENIQLKKEVEFLRNCVSKNKRLRDLNTPRNGVNSPAVNKFKYTCVLKPNCHLTSQLEKTLVETKAENLSLRENIDKISSKLKKNVGVYRENLRIIGKEVENLCVDFGEQSKQVQDLKESLVELA